MGACNTPLEKYFQDLPSGIFKAPKFLKSHLVNKKNKYAFVWWLQIMVVKRTAMEKRLQFFFTMFSTTVVMSTCNGLDLQTLRSQPIMPKNLPNHCTISLFNQRGSWHVSTPVEGAQVNETQCQPHESHNTLIINCNTTQSISSILQWPETQQRQHIIEDSTGTGERERF